jgi:hypothetical protein
MTDQFFVAQKKLLGVRSRNVHDTHTLNQRKNSFVSLESSGLRVSTAAPPPPFFQHCISLSRAFLLASSKPVVQVESVVSRIHMRHHVVYCSTAAARIHDFPLIDEGEGSEYDDDTYYEPIGLAFC